MASPGSPTRTTRASALAPPDHAMAWHTLDADQVVRALGSRPEGLTQAEAVRALERHGPNAIPKQPPPAAWQVTLRIWAEPMNAMLTIVAIFSFVFGLPETGTLVVLLVVLNLFMGASQELRARASVSALESLQTPRATVVRDGRVDLIPATDVIPGDVVRLEPGDLVPADARIWESTSLEAVESSLTGESAPVDKGVATLPDADAALGDRSNMVFQNTSITRGTATVVVTATGADTEMGKIAGMLTTVDVAASPLQQEMRSLTIRLAIVAWIAVVIIVAIALARRLPADQVVLLAITVAISAIPSGLPTYLTAMLSIGARRLAREQAVVRNLADVETLGCTSAINTDKTGTLTMDKMTVKRLFYAGSWYAVEGSGYDRSGAILGVAGVEPPDFTPLAYGLTLCSDATVSDSGEVVGDPTEAALVVLAAKMGVDAGISRREYARAALVPFDSEYKFMATFHLVPDANGQQTLIELVKGAPDVVLQRCATAYWGDEVVPVEQVTDTVTAANEEVAGQGMRALGFAYREFPLDRVDEVAADPMAVVADLTFVGLTGIIDPLRPSAKSAVATALDAGIDVRMITGDHAGTARAIAGELGLGPGVLTGPQLQRLTDAQLLDSLDELHVFGRVAPQDKLRLVTVMQDAGATVAMTGDAVNDAAALKKADVGVAMGSGSEVSKQAARMVLTDDNFSTLVRAVELGRDIYGKITAQLRYVLIGVFALLPAMLIASALDINNGQALTPVMLIFLTFLVGIFPAIGISTDSVEIGIMRQPPRDPRIQILNRVTAMRWVALGVLQAITIIVPYYAITSDSGAAQTTAFAVAGLTTVVTAACVRRDLIPAWHGPYVPYYLWLLVPLLLTAFMVESEAMNEIVGTQPLTGEQWALALGLSLLNGVVLEAEKAYRRFRRRQLPAPRTGQGRQRGMTPSPAQPAAADATAPAQVGRRSEPSATSRRPSG